MDIKLQGRSITFALEDVQRSGNVFVLLADIAESVMIKPNEFARIPTPVSFAGDGQTIALIDMHAGRLSHALDTHDENAPAHGEYFLPAIGEEAEVYVDVVNETGATLMIRPGMAIGALSLISLGQPRNDQTDLSNAAPTEAISIDTLFSPSHISPDLIRSSNTNDTSGLAIYADIAETFEVPAGKTRAITTGLFPRIPSGFEAHLRPDGLPDGTSVNIGRIIDRKPLTAFIQNHTDQPITVAPSDLFARLVLTPIAPAAFRIATNNDRATAAN